MFVLGRRSFHPKNQHFFFVDFIVIVRVSAEWAARIDSSPYIIRGNNENFRQTMICIRLLLFFELALLPYRPKQQFPYHANDRKSSGVFHCYLLNIK